MENKTHVTLYPLSEGYGWVTGFQAVGSALVCTATLYDPNGHPLANAHRLGEANTDEDLQILVQHTHQHLQDQILGTDPELEPAITPVESLDVEPDPKWVQLTRQIRHQAQLRGWEAPVVNNLSEAKVILKKLIQGIQP